jgi:hypothetical protein
MSRRQERKSKQLHPRLLKGLPLRQSFMIFCEGPTEAGYFSCFKTRAKPLGGRNALKIVEAAVAQKRMIQRVRQIDQYWVVFDKAIEIANANGIRVAWSNQAFELWFILHYEEFPHPWERQRYEEVLRRHIPGYSASAKGEEQGKKLFGQTVHLIKAGMENAQKGYSRFESAIPASRGESSTLVHELISVLLENM